MDTQYLSHVAMSVPRARYTPAWLAELARFYREVLGWTVDDTLSIEGERLLMWIPGSNQYLNVRAADVPMQTTGYEHLGIYVDTVDRVFECFAAVRQHASDSAELELDESVQTLYGGSLTTFRFRYLMPLAIEIQHVRRA